MTESESEGERPPEGNSQSDATRRAGSTTLRRPRRGDRFDVTIEGLDDRGAGMARPESLDDVDAEGCVAHVRGAVPGARVQIEVVKRRRSKLEARLAQVLAPSPDASEPRCPHADPCGGCSFQHLAYPAQLRALHERLVATFEPTGLLTGSEVEPVIGMKDPWHYRNKMDFTFGARRWRTADELEDSGAADDSFALGLHVPGVWSKVLDVERCSIAFEGADAILGTVRRLAREAELAPWDTRTHEGLLRHVVLRHGVRTNETMLVLVTSERAADRIEPLLAGVLAEHPELTTIVQDVTDRRSAVAVGDVQHVLHGPGVITESLGLRTFEISPHSFFQTNTVQAERLFEIVAEEAALSGDEVVWDLYCGAGTIGLFLADRVRSVVGFESVEPAVLDARRNAERNGIDAARFVLGDVLDSLEREKAAGSAPPDVAIVDPPRAGLHPKVPAALLELGAQRIVYVSCNPKSAARDVPLLVEGGYRVGRIRPVDLFPHTPHVETVVTLHRSNARP